jgi:hypothetical protein
MGSGMALAGTVISPIVKSAKKAAAKIVSEISISQPNHNLVSQHRQAALLDYSRFTIYDLPAYARTRYRRIQNR